MTAHATAVRLLHAPYTAPALNRGARAMCRYRDADVIITSWTDARISWPKCRRPDTHGGGSGLLVDEELARAVRCESVLAICYWWGVNYSVVWKWRKALGVERFNEGSAKLHEELIQRLAGENRGRRLSPEQVEQRRRIALEQGRRPIPGYVNGRPWTASELSLLGTVPDSELAAKIDRTPGAVRQMRTSRSIPSAMDRRRQEHRKSHG